jgi:hypothetical protein
VRLLRRLLVVVAFAAAGVLSGYLGLINASWENGSGSSFARDTLSFASVCLGLVLLLTAGVLAIRAVVLAFMREEPPAPRAA